LRPCSLAIRNAALNRKAFDENVATTTRCGDRAIHLGVALDPGAPLHIGSRRIAEQKAHTPARHLFEARPIEVLSLAGVGLDFEVAGVDDGPYGRI